MLPLLVKVCAASQGNGSGGLDPFGVFRASSTFSPAVTPWALPSPRAPFFLRKRCVAAGQSLAFAGAPRTRVCASPCASRAGVADAVHLRNSAHSISHFHHCACKERKRGRRNKMRSPDAARSAQRALVAAGRNDCRRSPDNVSQLSIQRILSCTYVVSIFPICVQEQFASHVKHMSCVLSHVDRAQPRSTRVRTDSLWQTPSPSAFLHFLVR